MGALFRIPGFFAFVVVLFLNAFVVTGPIVLVESTLLRVYEGEAQVILMAMMNGLILLPFVVLFSPAGYLSERLQKPIVMRYTAGVSAVLTLFIMAACYAGWFWLAFALSFLLAVQSAIFSPAKYGYIRELVGQAHIGSANAMVQVFTAGALLLSILICSAGFEQILGGRTFTDESAVLRLIAPFSWLLVGCAALGFVSTFRLPIPDGAIVEREFDAGEYVTGRYLRENFRSMRENRAIWLSIVGLSVCSAVALVVVVAFPTYARESVGIANAAVRQSLFVYAGIGVLLGSLLAGRVSRNYIETGLIPVAAAGFVCAVFLLSRLQSTSGLVADFLALGLFGGMLVVPLNALIQFHAEDQRLGAVLAGSNWVRSILMLVFLGLATALALTGTSGAVLFDLAFVVALSGCLYIVCRLPQSLVRYIIGRLFALTNRIEVVGFDNLPNRGGVLLLGNHTSWLDWAMIQIACPRPVRFVMHRAIYQRWYLKSFMDFFGVVSIASGDSAESLGEVNALLKAGKVVCLFPEGAISRNGQLGEFKRDYERCTEGVDGVIVPFYTRGLWGSRFSRSNAWLHKIRDGKLRRDVIVAFGQNLPIVTPAPLVKQHIFDLSIEAWEHYTSSLAPIPQAWMAKARREGDNLSVADAIDNTTLSGYRMLTSVLLFSRRIAKRSREQNVGLLLPTSAGGIIANLAVLLLNKTVVNLNYTASPQSIRAAVRKANLVNVYTSRRFVDKLTGRGVDVDAILCDVRVHYLEDIRDEMGGVAKLAALFAARFLPLSLVNELYGRQISLDDPAAILFSSGSEGEPKGVVLSHRNIMANIKQIADVLDVRQRDCFMSTLPLFHAFGLTVTGLMPVVQGIPAAFHPDPTDVANVAKAIARYQATVFCATSTFLRLFNRNKRIDPLMLDSLRLVVAGAEKLDPEVRQQFRLKFNKEIYEGYGTTETTPVASVNVPDCLDSSDWSVQRGSRAGTVGLPLPGGSFRIVDRETLRSLPTGEDGLIMFGGSQVMVGYLDDPERTAESIVEMDGIRWYKTGDKGHVDEDGFLTIVDRYSRFAKIGGEMVSLGAVESAISPLLPEDVAIAATALPDSRKGEQVVLLYAGPMTESLLKEVIAGSGLNTLMWPAAYVQVDEIPTLGSGKCDFSTVRRLAVEGLGGDA
jgi:acyl-[acyl-carrier-protein]-phospholipid O-acyltransferase/long-chain-fatty-acid--[acyl-carrier-protein] ligase